MHRNGAPTGQEPMITKSFSRLAHDVIELSELQARLLALDAQALSQCLRMSLALAAVTVLLLVGTVPLALLALAELFVEAFAWSRLAALSAAALIGVASSGLLLGFVWRSLNRGMANFERSREELTRNLAWIKSALRRSVRQPHQEKQQTPL